MNDNDTSIMAGIYANPILDTDSYKASHWLQYPPGTTGMFSYIESRGGKYPATVFFGLQMILKEYFSRRITRANVEEAAAFFQAHGEPFNRNGWLDIVTRLGGRLPLRIRAVPEGTVVPVGNVMASVESTDPACAWLVSYVETKLLRVWYPVTVATVSWNIRQVIKRYLAETADDLSGLPFKLHDFGARGVSSAESSAFGGAAHLVNFMGSDTVYGVVAANRYYHEPMAAFSIPAAEHSTITSWGKEHEVDAYRNMIRQYGKKGALFACVSDSFDIYSAVDHMWGEVLRQELLDSGAVLVVRPDSGTPHEVVLRCMILLDARFGSSVNSKGYKVLNNVRVIQGDGVDQESIERILATLKLNGFSADNVAFGMGGALLQRLDRDTQRFAMKCSAIEVNGQWRDVFKEPITDPGKASKRGRISLYRDASGGRLTTQAMPGSGMRDMMEIVWQDGELVRDWTLREVRSLAETG
jgi:nicotinamide phosphoribosyltransferase